jgi:hypothetical protein
VEKLNMKYLHILACLGLALADIPIHFTLTAVSSNSTFSGPIGANGEGWYINGYTDAYCPPNAPGFCSSYPNTTTVEVQNGRAKLWGRTIASWNQTLYVDPSTGFISYTIPNYNSYPPAGALLSGFEIVQAPDSSYELQFNNGETTSFTACPIYPGSPVLVGVNSDEEYCVDPQDIKIAAIPADEPGAYGYGTPKSPCITQICKD